ncbi:MAG: hypothetical protein WCK02_04800 [Bacteroidota bacterium]
MTKIALIFDFDDTLTSDSATFFCGTKRNMIGKNRKFIEDNCHSK